MLDDARLLAVISLTHHADNVGLGFNILVVGVEQSTLALDLLFGFMELFLDLLVTYLVSIPLSSVLVG